MMEGPFLILKLYKLICIVVVAAILFVVMLNNWMYLLLLWILLLSYYILKWKTRQILAVKGKAVLITGCDTGFGHYLAERLDKKGAIVFAGVLSEHSAGAKELKSELSNRSHVIQLDVTKDEHVKTAFEFVSGICKKDEFWGIVNNAGFYIPGDVELCTLSQFKRHAEVNLYGYIRIIKAALPLLRRSKGRIVNVSSVRGIYSCPELSAYNMTKFSIEALSDCLRLEMQKFGIKVSVIQPGVFDSCTGLSSKERVQAMKSEIEEMWDSATDEVKNAYGREYVDQIIRHLEGSLKSTTFISPAPVLSAIEDGLFNANPKRRYLIGGAGFPVDMYAALGRVYSFLPLFVCDAIMGKIFNRYHKTYRFEF